MAFPHWLRSILTFGAGSATPKLRVAEFAGTKRRIIDRNFPPIRPD
jgi:hypothetical protein